MERFVRNALIMALACMVYSFSAFFFFFLLKRLEWIPLSVLTRMGTGYMPPQQTFVIASLMALVIAFFCLPLIVIYLALDDFVRPLRVVLRNRLVMFALSLPMAVLLRLVVEGNYLEKAWNRGSVMPEALAIFCAMVTFWWLVDVPDHMNDTD